MVYVLPAGFLTPRLTTQILARMILTHNEQILENFFGCQLRRKHTPFVAVGIACAGRRSPRADGDLDGLVVDRTLFFSPR